MPLPLLSLCCLRLHENALTYLGWMKETLHAQARFKLISEAENWSCLLLY